MGDLKSKHLNNIFRDEGLNKNSFVSKMETTASDGNTHNIYINNTLPYDCVIK